MLNKSTLKKAAELIAGSSKILITSHIRPDGDACGCVIAMQEGLAAIGKKTELLMLSQVPQWYEFLFDGKPAVLGDDVTADSLEQGEDGDFDLIIIADTNSIKQLGGLESFLERNNRPILVIDHHIGGDGLGGMELIDSSAAAAAVIVFELYRYAGWEITEKTARALFVAIATDTGWFQFNNTDARALGVCGELVEAGAKPSEIYHRIYQNFSPERFALMVRMLNTLELHFDNRYAVQCIRVDDFERCGANFSDTENLIDHCRKIESLEVAGLFVELADGRIKVSLRSRSTVDVRAIACKFDGGGHKLAAGLHLAGPLESARGVIYDEVKKQLACQD